MSKDCSARARRELFDRLGCKYDAMFVRYVQYDTEFASSSLTINNQYIFFSNVLIFSIYQSIP